MKKTISLISLLLLAGMLACTLPLVWGSVENPVPTPKPPLDVGPALTKTGEPRPTQLPTNSPAEEPGTPEITQPPLPGIPAATPVSQPTTVPLIYQLQSGSPAAVPNFAHPEFGCNWLGLAGQVFSFSGTPEIGKVLEIGGELAGVETRLLGVTGGTAIYGEGGFEFTLSQRPLNSSKTLWIQVYDLDGSPLSDKYYFDTFDDCSRNLVLINFIGIAPAAYNRYFPVMIRN